MKLRVETGTENKFEVNSFFNVWDKGCVNYIYILSGEIISVLNTIKRKIEFYHQEESWVQSWPMKSTSISSWRIKRTQLVQQWTTKDIVQNPKYIHVSNILQINEL